MTLLQGTVFIVDDEEQARESVSALVQSMHYPAQTFDSAEEFLRSYDGSAGCLLTDYRLPGLNGLELQAELLARGHALPVVLVTAFARTPLTVEAIRNGAVTLLDKPYSDDNLWLAIREGLQIDAKRRAEKQQLAEFTTRRANLTDKEIQVLDRIVAGQPNKEIASQLGVSVRTIENRRQAVFSKLGAETVAELVSMVVKINRALQLETKMRQNAC